MKIQTVLGIAAVAVVLCLFATFLSEGSHDSSDDFTGDWTVKSYSKGYYEDGVPLYIQGFDEYAASIKPIDSNFYELIFDEQRLICVLDGDMLITSNEVFDYPLAVVYAEGDRMTVTVVDKQDLGFEVLYLERNGASAKSTGPLLRTSADYWPDEEETVYAIEAIKISEGSIENIIDNGYSIKILAKYEDMVFYENYCDATGTKFQFVSAQIPTGEWISVADFDDTSYLQDMVYVSDGVIRTASADYVSMEPADWYISYGDASKDKDLKAELQGKYFSGKERAKLVDCCGNILREFENDIVMYIHAQDGHMLGIYTEYGSGSFNDSASWTSMAEDKKGGVIFSVQSYFQLDGADYYGDYYGTISKDLSTITVNGVAIDTESNYYVVITQTYTGEEWIPPVN